MAVLSKEEFFSRFKELVPDATDDKTISFMDDVLDTFSNFSDEYSKEKYEELDAAWRKKYIDRFETTPSEAVTKQVEDIKKDSTKLTYDELFTEREKG